MQKRRYVSPQIAIIQPQQTESILAGSGGKESITVKPGWGSGQLTNCLRRDDETPWEEDGAASHSSEHWEN